MKEKKKNHLYFCLLVLEQVAISPQRAFPSFKKGSVSLLSSLYSQTMIHISACSVLEDFNSQIDGDKGR